MRATFVLVFNADAHSLRAAAMDHRNRQASGGARQFKDTMRTMTFMLQEWEEREEVDVLRNRAENVHDDSRRGRDCTTDDTCSGVCLRRG